MSIVVVLDAGNGVPVRIGLDPIDDATRSRLADRLATGASVPVNLGVEDLDTEGHAVATDEIVVDLYLDDDVEGHAVRLRFPTKEEAAAFRQGVLAAGRFVGSLQQGEPTPSHVALRPGAQINPPRSFHRG
jgi:hypothetical protein